jgi:hypothetical protein
MALIEKYHVVAAVRPVAAGQTIKEGMVVSLNNLGQVVKQGTLDAVTSTTPVIPYGIAGDTKSTTAASMPGIAMGNTNATGGSWQNRVSDYFDETKASGKMTVYHGGGEFATDQFHSNVAALTPISALYAYCGLLDTATAQSDVVVAYLTQADGAYPSGVPGTDVTGDMAVSGDNSNTYIEFKLMI